MASRASAPVPPVETTDVPTEGHISKATGNTILHLADGPVESQTQCVARVLRDLRPQPGTCLVLATDTDLCRALSDQICAISDKSVCHIHPGLSMCMPAEHWIEAFAKHAVLVIEFWVIQLAVSQGTVDLWLPDQIVLVPADVLLDDQYGELQYAVRRAGLGPNLHGVRHEGLVLDGPNILGFTNFHGNKDARSSDAEEKLSQLTSILKEASRRAAGELHVRPMPQAAMASRTGGKR